MWVDSLCLDQTADDRMKTIRRSDEIYSNANEYHLMEIGSISRGWVHFELCSVPLSPITHLTNNDPALIEMARQNLILAGFEGSHFTDEADRPFVLEKILNTYETVEEFNGIVNTIVNTIVDTINHR